MLGLEEVRALHRERGYQPPPRPLRFPILFPESGKLNELRVELTVDRDGRVTGTCPPAGRATSPSSETAVSTRKARTVRLEGEARRPDNDVVVPYIIEGTLESRQLNVGYRFGEHEGRATLRKTTRWQRTLRRRSRVVGRWAETHLEPILAFCSPCVAFDGRPRLRIRGASANAARHSRRSCSATPSPTISLRLPRFTSRRGPRHIPTCAARPPMRFGSRSGERRSRRGTTVVLHRRSAPQRRTRRLRERGRRQDGTGDLDKIYLVGDYQRLGLGRRLVGHVARRFLSTGITVMTLSADAANPSCRFYLALGAEHQRNDRGRVQRGAFVWRDLRKLAAICPVDPVDGPP